MDSMFQFNAEIGKEAKCYKTWDWGVMVMECGGWCTGDGVVV